MTKNKRTKDEYLQVATRLKLLRERSNLQQKEFAKEVGLSLTSYQNYEYGISLPTCDVLRKIAKYHDVTADYIIDLISVPLPIWREREKREE